MVVAATWTALVVMGRLGVVNKTSADVWRLRLYGVGSLLLALSTGPCTAAASPVARHLLDLIGVDWTTVAHGSTIGSGVCRGAVGQGGATATHRFGGLFM